MRLKTNKKIAYFLGLAFLFTPAFVFADNFSLIFDGVNDFVDVGKNSELDLGNNFQISARIKTTLETGFPQFISRIDEGGAYDIYWYMGFSASADRIEVSLGDGTNFSQIFSSSTITTINDGEWHDIVFTKTGDTQTIYVDGIFSTFVNFIDAGIGNVNSTTTNVYFGGDVESFDFFFTGSIDNVQIDTGGVCVGFWDFNEGVSPVNDTCGINNDFGTVSGALFVNLSITEATGLRFLSGTTQESAASTLGANVTSSVGSLFPVVLLSIGVFMTFYVLQKILFMFPNVEKATVRKVRKNRKRKK